MEAPSVYPTYKQVSEPGNAAIKVYVFTQNEVESIPEPLRNKFNSDGKVCSH